MAARNLYGVVFDNLLKIRVLLFLHRIVNKTGYVLFSHPVVGIFWFLIPYFPNASFIYILFYSGTFFQHTSAIFISIFSLILFCYFCSLYIFVNLFFFFTFSIVFLFPLLLLSTYPLLVIIKSVIH